MGRHARGLSVAQRIRSSEDYRARPNRRGSRPRTKRRPDYSDAPIGVVVSVDRGRYRTVIGDELADVAADAPIVTCVRASHLRRTPLVPGDRVRVTGDVSGDEGTLARIVELEERRTLLRRSADDVDDTERALVANADTLVVVTATADPEPSWGLIDRTIVAAFDAGMHPVIAVTKTDLGSSRTLRERFDGVDVEILECGFDDEGLPRTEALLPALVDRVSVLVGHSGVGKSTLINRLVPGADRATGSVNDVTGRGRHTSSSAVCLALPAGGWVVDTPGVRSFGLAHVDVDDVVAAFDELAPATADCPKLCPHTADAPGCALDGWVSEGRAGEAGEARLRSLRRLLDNLSAT